MHPVAKTRPLPPLTEAEAYERACKLMKNDYQSFGEVEARRVIDGLLRGMDAAMTEIQINTITIENLREQITGKVAA